MLFGDTNLVFLSGYMNTKCLCAAVELQIPDILREHSPLSVEELASKSGARSDRLEQILNVLQNNGIFTYHDGKYSNNHTSMLLLRDHWTQWHNWIALYGNQFYDMSRGIPGSIRKEATRNPAQIEYDTDKDMFTYFREHDWVGQLHRTLGGGATAQSPGIVADYQWEEISGETIIDVGGGGGALIALLLRAYPTMRGGIYDLPHVIDHTAPFFHTNDGQFADLSDRVPKENLIGVIFLTTSPIPSLHYEVDTSRLARCRRHSHSTKHPQGHYFGAHKSTYCPRKRSRRGAIGSSFEVCGFEHDGGRQWTRAQRRFVEIPG